MNDHGDYGFVKCEVCGSDRGLSGTKRCDGCWEVEHRLAGYLRTGGEEARLFVIEALRKNDLGNLCSHSGCKNSATRPAAPHESDNGEKQALPWYCEKHAKEVSESKNPEYVVDCPACGCSFGVN